MNMKNEILTNELAPKLKDVLQEVKEVLAHCACFIAEMVIAIVCRLHERGLWPSGQPCGHSHVQPTKQAAKSNIPTTVKPIGTHPHRHALHEALRQNVPRKRLGEPGHPNRKLGDAIRFYPLRAAKSREAMRRSFHQGP